MRGADVARGMRPNTSYPLRRAPAPRAPAFDQFSEEFYDRDLRPSRGTQADVVHGSCMLLAKSHLPAVQCVQEHHPPCKRMPADLVISRVAALASGGSRSANCSILVWPRQTTRCRTA